jgi:hypothetical protein
MLQYTVCDSLMESLAVPPNRRAAVIGVLDRTDDDPAHWKLIVPCPLCGGEHAICRLVPGSWDVHCGDKWAPVLVHMVICQAPHDPD